MWLLNRYFTGNIILTGLSKQQLATPLLPSRPDISSSQHRKHVNTTAQKLSFDHAAALNRLITNLFGVILTQGVYKITVKFKYVFLLISYYTPKL